MFFHAITFVQITKTEKPLTTETQRHREKAKERKDFFLVFSVKSLCLEATRSKSKFVSPAKAENPEFDERTGFPPARE
jgi:hypothetical protein